MAAGAAKAGAKRTAARPAFEARATEATELIGRLISEGLTTAEIAVAVRVSDRTVYRWWRENKAPHPIMLDGLRKLVSRKRV